MTTPQLSVVRGSLPTGSTSVADVLHEAARHAFGGVTFYSLFELSPSLDTGELGAHKALADSLGLRLGASLDWLNPARPDKVAPIAALGGGDLMSGLERLIAAAARIGIHEMYFSIGTLEDRDNGWPEQLDALHRFLAGFLPVARAHGTRLLVKTHEEITSLETLELVERLDSDWLGVSFDPANVLVRIEDPVAAARRLAPHIRQLHLDDAILKPEGEGVRRYLCPLGDGIIDWPQLRALAPSATLLLELHRGQFAMPIHNPGWLARQTYLAPSDLAKFADLVARGQNAAIPDQNDIDHRLAVALQALRQGGWR